MDAYDDPFAHFDAWHGEAAEVETQVDAAALATAGAEGHPSNRMVLVRRWSERGFEVQTGVDSWKAEELRANPWAALTWWWPALERQVRVEGQVEWLSDAESDEYWRMRSRESQVTALASEQSQPAESRDAILARHREMVERYRDAEEIPRLNWAGFRVRPLRVEFFIDREDKLQDRLEYKRDALDGPWRIQVLQP